MISTVTEYPPSSIPEKNPEISLCFSKDSETKFAKIIASKFSQWNTYPSTTLSLDIIESKTEKKNEYNPYIFDTHVTTLIIQIKFYIKENVTLQTLQHSVLKQMVCHPKLYLQYVFYNIVMLKE